MKDWYIPKNGQGEEMSPVEASTGIVLPLWAPPRNHSISNRHHAHFYESTYINGPDEIRAVRFSRLQRVDKGWHKDYHDSFKGTELPPDIESAFRITILNAAKYIPRFAVDMTKQHPNIIELSKKQKRALRQPKVFLLEKPKSRRQEIGSFFMRYAIDQNLDDENRYKVEEFVGLIQEDSQKSRRKEERKIKLGMELTDLAMALAVSPFESEYRQARQERLFAEGAPRTAFRALKHLVRGYEPDYFQEFGQRLEASLQAA